jgi:hypothetical protein
MDPHEQLQVISDALQELGYQPEAVKGNSLNIPHFASISVTRGDVTVKGKKAPEITAALERIGIAQHVNISTQGGQRREEADETAADELLTYLDNEEDIYRQKQAIAANLIKKIKKGTYSHSRAQDAWLSIADVGAKKYAREFGTQSEWSRIFVPATRDLVAKMLADRWAANAKDGRPDEV